MLKEYLELTRYKGFTVGFQYNHDDLYLRVRLTKDGNVVDCIIDYDDLSDDERIIEKIEEALKRFK